MNDLPQQILKGSLSAIILKLLSENEAMYGYEICQRVKEITAGQMRVTEGALYPALHKLEGEGILHTHTQVVEGRTRKYYSIVPDQHGQAVSRLAQMQAFLEQLQQVLNPQVLTLILFVAGSLPYLAIFRYSHRELYPDPY